MFTVTYNVQSQASQRKSPQQSKSVHVTEYNDVSPHQQQHYNWYSSCKSNGVVRRATHPVAFQNKSREELHARKRHKHVVSANNSCITSKHQQSAGTYS